MTGPESDGAVNPHILKVYRWSLHILIHDMTRVGKRRNAEKDRRGREDYVLSLELLDH